MVLSVTKLNTLALALLLSISPLALASPASDSVSPCTGMLKDQQKFANCTVSTFDSNEDDFDACVEVRRDGQLRYSKHGMGKLVIGNDFNKNAGTNVSQVPDIPIGTDITGLGKPNVIFVEWSGGAHCCFTFHVLELGETVREVATVDAEDSDYAHFEDLKHDGTFEFTGWDWTFQYWHTSFASSPAPQIILRFNGTAYELAPDLMRKPAPSAQELSRIESKVLASDWENGYPPPLLWATMLNLIYTGHPELAWKLVPGSWKPGNMPQDKFLQEFCGRLAASPYFAKLRSTIKDAPCEFDPKYGID